MAPCGPSGILAVASLCLLRVYASPSTTNESSLCFSLPAPEMHLVLYETVQGCAVNRSNDHFESSGLGCHKYGSARTVEIHVSGSSSINYTMPFDPETFAVLLSGAKMYPSLFNSSSVVLNITNTTACFHYNASSPCTFSAGFASWVEFQELHPLPLLLLLLVLQVSLLLPRVEKPHAA
uniref:GP3 protein n=1 Tax=Pebjah virus TaxID=1658615 RepID=A0A0G2UH73_9NIDO|nr:GP3 protein [Pebjah virus]